MSKLFAKLAKANIKQMNPMVMNGLACTYIPLALNYMNSVFESASRSFPIGLEYVGYSRCTPEEEHNEMCRQKNNKRNFDLSKSDTYLVKYFFKYEGIPLPPRFIYLPYVNSGGVINISGPAYHLTPVLSDKVISPGFNTIFVKLLRDKIIFKRLYHTIVVNSKAESRQIIYSEIYRNKNKKSGVPKTTNALTCIGHYLFAKNGVTDTFKKYCDYVPIFGYSEITKDKYPPDKWSIYESAEIKPKTFLQKDYITTKIKVAVPIEHNSKLMQQLICEFFYIADNFPTRIRCDSLDRTNLWKILLGHIIFSGNFSESKLFENIEEHFQSLSEYADLIVIEKLKENNYTISDFFDLMALILKEFNNLLLHSTVDFNNVYEKTYEVLYYVLFEITSGVFSTNFKLNKLASKKKLTEKDITETFNRQLRIGAIYSLTSGKVVANSVAYSGDHKYPKITSTVNEQENIVGSSRGKKSRRTIGQSQRLHTSAIEIGSVLFLPKSNPSPVVRINPYVNIDIVTGSILPKPHLKELLERTQSLLAGVNESDILTIAIGDDIDSDNDIGREEN